MQIFVTGSPFETAKNLDRRRFNKQIIECSQILNAIHGAKAWKNHPIIKSYKNHSKWVEFYLNCFHYYNTGDLINSLKYSEEADKIRPNFQTEEYFNQMKRRLFTKDKEFYKKWSYLGESDINWYFIDSEWVFYKNGKKL